MFGLFAHKVHFDGQLSDLGVQLIGLLLKVLGSPLLTTTAEYLDESQGHLLLPIGDLPRMNIVVLGDLLNGLEPFRSFKRHSGLKFGIVSLSLCFHVVSLVRFGFSSQPVLTTITSQLNHRPDFRGPPHTDQYKTAHKANVTLANQKLQEDEILEAEYARLLIPDDAAYVAEIKSKSDRCTDLYPFAKGQPDSVLTVEKKPLAEIDQDIAIELAKLDPGESSTALTRGGQRMFLMLCGREPITEEPVSRDAIRDTIINTKLNGLAEQLLEELRAAAIIKKAGDDAAEAP